MPCHVTPRRFQPLLVCILLLHISCTQCVCDMDMCKCSSRAELTVLCSCPVTSQQQMLLVQPPPPNTQIFRVENCQSVVLAPQMFANVHHLRLIHLSSIAQLNIQENAFTWSKQQQTSINIQIDNSTILNIPSFAFQGRVESVSLRNCRVGNVASFAFTNLDGTSNIEFIDTHFTQFQPQAFKKFSVETLTLQGGAYGAFPSRTMVDLEVGNLLIDNISAVWLHTSAFVLHGTQSFHVQNSRFDHIDGESFRVLSRGPVHIENNVFMSLASGAFAGIHAEQQYKLSFNGNNLTNFQTGALLFNTTRFVPELDRILVDDFCACNAIELWSVQLQTDPATSLRQKLDADKTSKALDVLYCRCDADTGCTRSFHEYSVASCGVLPSSMHVILMTIISSTLVLLVVCLVTMTVLCRRRRSRNRHWTNVSTKQDELVVPDGRTYRETELHVIVEQAEPIGDQNVKPVPLPRTALTQHLAL